MPKMRKNRDVEVPDSAADLRRMFAEGEAAAQQRRQRHKRRAKTLAGTRMATRGEYEPDKAIHIIEQVSMGKTLSKVCEEPGMPNRRQFYLWTLTVPELREAWYAARKMKASSLFDEALDLARGLVDTKWVAGDSAKVNALRTAIDHLRWSAAKLDPQAYGEKALQTPAIVIQINTGLDLGKGATPSDAIDASFEYTLSAVLPQPAPQPQPPEAADGQNS